MFFIGISQLVSVVKLTAQEKKLDSFTISYASVSGTRAPLWIAKDLGLFEKYGLDCFECQIADFEALEHGADVHKVNVEMLLQELNRLIRS